MSTISSEFTLFTLNLWQAIVLAIIEGLTEYLPISSTGHIILGSSLLGVENDAFLKNYSIIVQFGAIFSVLIVYRDRFLHALKTAGRKTMTLYFFAFLPAAVIGLLLSKKIDQWLGDISVIGWSLLIGGFVLLFLDYLEKKLEKISVKSKKAFSQDALNIPIIHAVTIGFSQCLALIPGVSRSAASITGAISLGYSRKTAAEFSFFLGVPTLVAASFYKLLKMGDALNAETAPIIIIGNVISFAVGILAIKTFISFLQRRGFFWFGIYRIVFGASILLLLALGYNLQLLD